MSGAQSTHNFDVKNNSNTFKKDSLMLSSIRPIVVKNASKDLVNFLQMSAMTRG